MMDSVFYNKYKQVEKNSKKPNKLILGAI